MSNDAKRRTEVKDLPRPERELTEEERRGVKGGVKAEMYCEDAATIPAGQAGLGSEKADPNTGGGLSRDYE